MLNGKSINAFLCKIRNGMLTWHYFSFVPEVLTTILKQEKEIKGKQIGKKINYFIWRYECIYRLTENKGMKKIHHVNTWK